MVVLTGIRISWGIALDYACSYYKYANYTKVDEFNGIDIYTVGEITLSAEELTDMKGFYSLMPEKLRQYPPRQIIFAGENAGLNESTQKKLDSVGGLAVCDKIVVAPNSTAAIADRPASTYKRIEHVMVHEWMHIVQFAQEQDNSFWQYISPMDTSKFITEYARSASWRSTPFMDTHIFYVNPEDDEFATQSEYGQTKIVEDMAETAAYFSIGQPQILSEGRIKWMEEFTNTDVDDYSALVWPWIDGNFKRHYAAEGNAIPLEGKINLIGSKKVQEYLDKYPYVTFSLYQFEDNHSYGFFLSLLDEMERRGFMTSVPRSKTCNDELYDCLVYYEVAKYESLFESYYFAYAQNHLVVLEGSYRKKFIDINIPNIFDEELILEEN